VACYPDLLAIATEEVIGPTLLHHLHTEAAWFPSDARVATLLELMGTTGRWIRSFQHSVPGGGHTTIDGLRRYVDDRLQRLVRGSASFTERDRHAVLNYIDAVGAQVAREDLAEVAIHSDLGPGNILVCGRRVVVLDFGMTRLGTRLHDLARLYVQLELMAVKPWFRAELIHRLQRALMDGFDPMLTLEHPLFRLLLLLHRVNHLGTVTLTHTRIPEAFYNRFVSRQHRRWINAELTHTRGAARDDIASYGSVTGHQQS
jgi:hypothetical protein